MACRIQLIADPQIFRAFFHPVDKLVVYFGRNQDAGAGIADLSLMKKCAETGAFNRQVHIRIVKDNIGRFTAQLEGDLFNRIGQYYP